MPGCEALETAELQRVDIESSPAAIERLGFWRLEAQAEPIAGVVCQIRSIARGERVERICNLNSMFVIHCD